MRYQQVFEQIDWMLTRRDRYRQSQAPDLFLGAYLPAHSDGASSSSQNSNNTPSLTLIGYICATTSPASTLTHDSMSTHVPGASSVCIHSVCVAPEYRRRGIALRLLKEYISTLDNATNTPYTRILLIAHDDLVPLYEKAGFTLVGPSKVQHGARPWFEMRRDLGKEVLLKELGKELPPAQAAPPRAAPPAQAPDSAHIEAQQPQSFPPGLFEALQRSSTRARPSGKLLSALPGGMADVVEANADKVRVYPSSTQASVTDYLSARRDAQQARPALPSRGLRKHHLEGRSSNMDGAGVGADGARRRLPESLPRSLASTARDDAVVVGDRVDDDVREYRLLEYDSECGERR